MLFEKAANTDLSARIKRNMLRHAMKMLCYEHDAHLHDLAKLCEEVPQKSSCSM